MLDLNLTRRQKHTLMIITDTVLVPLSLWLAFALRLSEWFWPNSNQLWLFILGPVLAIPIFIQIGLYREVVRYIGQRGILAIVKATGIFVFLWLLVAITVLPIYLGIEIKDSRFLDADIMFPRSIPVLFWMTLLLTVGGSRQVARWLLFEPFAHDTTQARKNVLIYGASRVGLELASSLSHNKDIRVLGIIDDDSTLHGHFIQDLKVMGDRYEIPKIRSTNNPLEVLLAIPKIYREQRKALLKFLEDKNVTVRTIPSLNEITSRKVTMNDLRDVDITDLLARKVVEPNQRLLTASVTNKRVLVTGAGGSIGSELCRQILPLNPICIVLFEHSEHSLYNINQELISQVAKINSNVNIIAILGSINNKQRVEETIKNFKIDTIYHAAAYKHITLIEYNIEEGVRNNIFGTYHVAQAALDLNVERFILISTDKAVRPTSVMGATKHFAELIAQGLSQKRGTDSIGNSTHFIIVRFGNVLGSSGSVIPLFQQQIASGGPITITHPEVTRYFMTISEASQLVIQAGSIGGSGIFALNMGDPISILSLAKQLVYLSGRMLNTDEAVISDSTIEIKYTGLKKGEKIHEELFIGDNITSTEHPMIMEAQEPFCMWSEIEEILNELESNKNMSDKDMRQLLMQYAWK